MAKEDKYLAAATAQLEKTKQSAKKAKFEAKAKMAEAGGNAITIASGLSVAYLDGRFDTIPVLDEKEGDGIVIGGIPVFPVLGALAVVGGMFMKGSAGTYTASAGAGAILGSLAGRVRAKGQAHAIEAAEKKLAGK